MGLKFRLYYLAPLTAFWFLFTFLISYLVAVLNGHVNVFLPFISDTGTMAPESCIFGILLNIGSLLMFYTMYVKYKLIQLKHSGNTQLLKLNNWSVFFGGLTCLGMCIVANFQETNVLIVHFIGAFMAFIIGSIYFIIQTWITCNTNASKMLKYSRISISTLLIPAYIISTVCALYMEPIKQLPMVWPEDSETYGIQLVAAIFEWILAFLMFLYILTFTYEFKAIEFDEIIFIQTKYNES